MLVLKSLKVVWKVYIQSMSADGETSLQNIMLRSHLWLFSRAGYEVLSFRKKKANGVRVSYNSGYWYQMKPTNHRFRMVSLALIDEVEVLGLSYVIDALIPISNNFWINASHRGVYAPRDWKVFNQSQNNIQTELNLGVSYGW